MKSRVHKQQSAVVLLSGGIDSSTLLHHVKLKLGYRKVYVLCFSYGQKHKREIEMARRQARIAGVAAFNHVDLTFHRVLAGNGSVLTDPARRVPDLSALRGEELDQPPTYVPHRNLLFLSIAASYAEALGVRHVFFGAQAQDEYGYWDCTTGFVRRLNSVLSLNRRKAVRVYAPFAKLSKTRVVRLGLALGVDYSQTWTCYRGGARPCGRCPSCVERRRALKNAHSRA